MAKLAAHGTEVARLDVTRTVPDIEYRVVLSYRSDGHVLRNLNGAGWKLYQRVRKPKVSYTDAMLKLARRQHDDYLARSGDTVVNAYTVSV